ncbi:MAG TPA: hypothetical protein VIX37_18395, partial [Candidatus Sulfotelmatobacter sp.]
MTKPSGGLSGWNASATFKMARYVGFVADFAGYYPGYNFGLCARIWRNVHSTRVLKGTYSRSAARPNDTFSPEWPINWGLAMEMALRGRDDGRSTETVLLALGAWKP